MSAQLQRMEDLEPDRTKYIGGSDTAAILGVSPWKSAFILYQEKIGEYREEVTPAKQKIFNRGKRWEPIVIEMLVDELEDRGHDVEIIGRNNRYKDPEYDFLAAEIDLELVIDGELINGEMKTVHPFAAKDWGEEGTDEIPMYYVSQVLHGMMVTQRNKTVVAGLIGADDLRVHFVSRDDEFIQIMRGKELEFWERIQTRDAPDPTTADDIKRLYQFDAGSVIEADEELLDLCTELASLRVDSKIIETGIETLSTRIKSRMGEAALLIHNGQKLATWKNNKDSTKIDWQSAYLDLKPDPLHINKFSTTKPGARPFSLK